MFTKIIARFDSNTNLYPLFNPIDFSNGLTLSIQAGHNHYCSPQRNLGFAKDYNSFEVSINNLNDVPSFMNEYYCSELEVYKYVPIEKVHKLVEYYRNKYKLKYWHDEILYTS